MTDITQTDRELLAVELDAPAERAKNYDGTYALHVPETDMNPEIFAALRAIAKLRQERDEARAETRELRVNIHVAENQRDAAIAATKFADRCDREDEYSELIRDAHPTVTKNHDTYLTAMQMVGNRYSKGALVCLVNWLLVERDLFLRGRDDALAEREHYAKLAAVGGRLGDNPPRFWADEGPRLLSLLKEAGEVLEPLKALAAFYDGWEKPLPDDATICNGWTVGNVRKASALVEKIKGLGAYDSPMSSPSAAERGSSGWQDISTAPRDGKTQFLALLSNGWHALLTSPEPTDWPYQWWHTSCRLSIPVVETHPKDTDWKASHTILATHWMPLPSPPNKEPGQ